MPMAWPPLLERVWAGEVSLAPPRTPSLSLRGGHTFAAGEVCSHLFLPGREAGGSRVVSGLPLVQSNGVAGLEAAGLTGVCSLQHELLCGGEEPGCEGVAPGRFKLPMESGKSRLRGALHSAQPGGQRGAQ